MTKVDFYISSAEGTPAKESVACKLVDKAYKLNHKIYIHTDSAQDTKRLDDLLWTFRPGSFIPHTIYHPGEQAEAAVQIGHHEEPNVDCTVLINLTSSVPLFFSQFERVAEIVDADPQSRSLARERFKFYKDRGYELSTHELDR